MKVTKSVQKVSKKKKDQTGREQPKTSVRYWEAVVFRNSTLRDGEVKTARFYSVKIAHEGKRQTFNLRTAERTEAARKAKRIYLSLVSCGWEETLDEFKPARKKTVVSNSIETVGQLIEASEKALSVGKRTGADYARAFRFIVSGVLGVGSPRKLGLETWKAKYDETPICEITPARVLAWKKLYLDKHANDAAALRAAKNTANSLMRKAKGLFSKKVLPFLDLPDDFVFPFQGVPFEARQSMKYRSRLDLSSLTKVARYGDEMKSIKPLSTELFKIFVLAGMAGLRRNEIDKLEWSAFLWDDGIIRLETTTSFEAKSEESISDVAIDKEIIDFFREDFREAKSTFVIESNVPPRVGTTHSHYRCESLFKQLVGWLRKAGVDGQKPIHTLRKEFGSLVCDKFGIYAASTALRHADIHITSQHYVDSKRKIRPDLGGLISD